jgi:hypothetical protein
VPILNLPEQSLGNEHPEHMTGKIRVAELLSDHGFTVEYEHPWVLNSEVTYFTDIYLPDDHICVEVDGRSHEGKTNKWRDSMKDDFINAQSGGNRTIRVKLEDALDYPGFVLGIVVRTSLNMKRAAAAAAIDATVNSTKSPKKRLDEVPTQSSSVRWQVRKAES